MASSLNAEEKSLSSYLSSFSTSSTSIASISSSSTSTPSSSSSTSSSSSSAHSSQEDSKNSAREKIADRIMASVAAFNAAVAREEKEHNTEDARPAPHTHTATFSVAAAGVDAQHAGAAAVFGGGERDRGRAAVLPAAAVPAAVVPAAAAGAQAQRRGNKSADHLSWMILVVFVSIVAIVARKLLRRLGKESLGI